MRILVVAMANSIHTVRWLQQFDNDKDIEFILLPSTLGSLKRELRQWVRILSPLARLNIFPRAVIQHIPVNKINTALHYILDYWLTRKWRTAWLKRIIKRTKPDIIHSLEFQHAGYTCLSAKMQMGKDFPTWIATNWGSDIYLFAKLKGHDEQIKGILENADFYSAECLRDYELAQRLGMKATPLPVIPNAGGMHIEKLESLRNSVVPSQRKILLIKGYQMVFGRALSALRALEKIADELKSKNVKVCIFSVTPDIEISVELTALKTGLDIEVMTAAQHLSHEDILKLHAQARCYVGLSISDGISTSMLEAMALGAFPIQTCTSCADEWIKDNVSGFIAPCDAEDVLSEMILRAFNDDVLVDKAAEMNWNTIKEKAAYEYIQPIAKSFYTVAYEHSQKNAGA